MLGLTLCFTLLFHMFSNFQIIITIKKYFKFKKTHFVFLINIPEINNSLEIVLEIKIHLFPIIIIC